MLDSGGIPKVLTMRNAIHPGLAPLKVDLHPERPLRRCVSIPPAYVPLASLGIDPSFEEINGLNGLADLHAECHEIVGRDGERSGVGVSGEVKRRYPFEKGVPGGQTWMVDENGKGGWFMDEVSPPTGRTSCSFPAHQGRTISSNRREG